MYERERRLVLKGLALAGALAWTGRAPAATTPIRWPSDEAAGSVGLQTAELTRLLNQNDASILVKAGVHAVEGPIISNGNRVTLKGEPGAVLNFVHSDKGGLRPSRCANFRLEDLTLRWDDTGQKVRRSHYGAGVLFFRCSDPFVARVRVERAPGGGIQFDECPRGIVENCSVDGTGADGIHFANSNSATIRDCTCENTGDDAIAIVDYAKKPQGKGFVIERCRTNASRARGIAIVGGSDGTVVDCVIGTTSSNGLHIESDRHYDTRNPRNVKVSHVTISGTGELLPKVGNQYGVNILRAQDIELTNVIVDVSTSIGVSVADSNHVVLRAMKIINRRRGPAMRLLKSDVDLVEISLSGGGAEILVADSCDRVTGSSVQVLERGPGDGKQPIRLTNIRSGTLELTGVSRRDVHTKDSALSLAFK